ncbi:MAG: Rieske 2Fe-2S domain-containing protein [Chloroflexi bacterium]|nr:Rieske 2Fe-2S domain-containing protein [Chloroflexota bacterium]MBV9600077.1 Rieske 2Fe-2S domain-containing protein [Chloroflexota bacterium]
MLIPEENEALCRVGPGTLMGKLMREYWVPALLSSEVPAPDSDPLRVLILGEQLIAFRDTGGQVGLIQNNCPHRGASLFFGRNEESGLRCVYHGWKFSVDGTCVDMPNEPAESDFKHKVRAVAYPTRERGGIVWAYLGPRSTPPPLPSFEGNMLPEDEGQVTAIQRECNWFQGLEGDIDTSHFSFLHAGSMDVSTQQPGTFSYYMLADRAPRYSVVDTDFGTMYGAYRETDDGRRYWRVANFLFPFWTMPPQGMLGHKITARGWVPMDDTHTMFYMAGPRFRRAAAPAGPWNRMQPNTTNWLGRFRLTANASNDYMIDREKQRRNSAMDDFTGIQGIHLQDQAITESEGPLYDRSSEHLASSDMMIIRVRRRLMMAAHALAEQGLTPPGVDDPEVFGARAGGVFLPREAEWLAATEDLRRGFVKHPELDSSITGPLV